MAIGDLESIALGKLSEGGDEQEQPPEAEPPAEQPPSEAPADPEPEDGDEGEAPEDGDEDAQEGDEGAEPPPEDADAIPLEDETAKVRLGDETISVADLKAERLKWGDYTKKTQALADEKRTITAERDEAKQQIEDVRAWLSTFNDPDTLGETLEQSFPRAFHTLIQSEIDRRIEEADLTAEERELRTENRRLKAERRRDAAGTATRKQADEDAAHTARVDELRVKFGEYRATAFEAAGLKPKDEADAARLTRLIHAELPQNTEWSEAHFVEAAKSVADVIDSRTIDRLEGMDPEALEAAIGKEGMAALRKSQLAKVKGRAKAPPNPGKGTAAPRKKAKRKGNSKPKKLGSAFDDLRERYSV